MKALFRVDASTIIGSGHLMRCLTLARMLQQNGWQVMFCCRAHPGNMIGWLQSQDMTVLSLSAPTSEAKSGYAGWLGVTELEDAAEVQQQLTSMVDLLVIDHYGLSEVFEKAMAAYCRLLLVIDDLANRPHDCHYLLDQNLYPQLLQRYQSLVQPETKLLLGPEFALLRAEFAGLRRTVVPGRLHVLVFFGGTDQQNLTALTIFALQQLQKNDFTADIVIGLANPHQRQLHQLCQQDHRFRLHIQTTAMATLMSQATLMIGAGGSTHWERCAVGLPALVVTVADNQIESTSALANAGACIWLGNADKLTIAGLKTQITELWQQPAKLVAMSTRAKQLVPTGGGCRTIVTMLQQALAD